MSNRHRRRRGVRLEESDSSDDEEDAFSALSRKGNASSKPSTTDMTTDNAKKLSMPIVPSTTSSMKRHHGAMNSSRKAHMDALLHELGQSSSTTPSSTSSRNPHNRRHPSSNLPAPSNGSFVEPGEELHTTNLFVGNLAPTLTEDRVVSKFREFGELYSVKIMWPRTPEERARNANKGFVCYRNRRDAEDAMEACHDRDVFRVGRRLFLSWGKHVLKDKQQRNSTVNSASSSSSVTSITRSGARKRSRNMPLPSELSNAIRVVAPSNEQRRRFLSTVAKFVSQDGSALEQQLLEREKHNPDFAFLKFQPNAPYLTKQEHIYYRWRVYAFCQGDTMENWNTNPFFMVQGGRQAWIPPPINDEKVRREDEEVRKQEALRQKQRQQRRRYDSHNERERDGDHDGHARDRSSRHSWEGTTARNAERDARLSEASCQEFRTLTREKLTSSRESVCRAMAFCFEHSTGNTVQHVIELLRELMLEDRCSVETRVARLFLLSDILYNSQQPGVKNAFRYRDAIESMAPEVFRSLGLYAKAVLQRTGRMRWNKLKTAVSSVLSAWTNWSVYNPTFIDELEDRFNGKEIVKKVEEVEQRKEEEKKPEEEEEEIKPSEPTIPRMIDTPKGDWTDVKDEDKGATESPKQDGSPEQSAEGNKDGGEQTATDAEVDDIDGEPLEDGDLDEEGLAILRAIHEVTEDEDNDGGSNDLDGEPIEEGDLEKETDNDPKKPPLGPAAEIKEEDTVPSETKHEPPEMDSNGPEITDMV